MERCLKCMKEYKEGDVCPHCGYVKGTPPKEVYHLIPGMILQERYRIGTCAGAGGFGVVYRAWDMTLEKLVAIKEYYPVSLVSRAPGTKTVYVYAKKREREYREGMDRFLEEARNVARFSTHPNIVNVYNFFEENNTAYCVMEFLDGLSLKECIREKGGVLEEETAVKVVSEVLDALADIHKTGIIHRDIAPDNVHILKNGVVKLMDFGAARFARGDEEAKRPIELKPGFAPPEQYKSRSKQGPYTDLYAVGAMLYRAVTGVMPDESVNRIEEDSLIPPRDLNPELSEKLNSIILRAMALQSELRFQTAAEFKAALQENKRVLDDREELKRRKKKRKLSVLAAVLCLMFGFGVCALVYDSKRAETELKPAELIIWVPASEEETEDIQAAYDSIVEGFRETYPQIKVQVNVLESETYEERLKNVAGTDEMPDLYDSSDLSRVYNAASVEKVINRLDLTAYYGLSDYLKQESEPVKLPVSFQREAVYVNSVLAGDLEVTAGMLKDRHPADEGEVEKFLDGETEFIWADTACYYLVNTRMSGRYKMYAVPSGIVQKAVYENMFCMSDRLSVKEKNAAYRFLEYLLSDNAQYILCVQSKDGLPINRETYETFVELNSEFDCFETAETPKFVLTK